MASNPGCRTCSGRALLFPTRGTKSIDHVFNVRVERHAQRSGRLRRRRMPEAARPDHRCWSRAGAHAVVRRRERVFRRALVGADLFAGLLVVGLAPPVFGAGPGITALALLPLIVVINTTSGLYRRDELLLRKSTLDEAPALFQAATLTTVVAFLLESALLAHADGRASLRGHLAGPVGPRRSRAAWPPARSRGTSPRPSAACSWAMPAVAARLEAKLGGQPEREGDLRRSDSPRREARVRRRRRTRHARRAAAGRRRARRPPRDRRRRAATHQSVLDAIQSAKALGVRVSVLPRMFEVVGSSVAFDYVDGLTILGVRRFGSPRSRRVKRAFDIVGSALGLCCSRRCMVDASRWLVKLDLPGARSSSARRASAATASRSRCSSSARWRRRRRAKGRAAGAQRGRRAVQDRRRPADHARRPLPAQDLARRAAAARQRAARRDEPRRSAPARRGRGRAGRGLVSAPPAPDARDDRALADPRLGAVPLREMVEIDYLYVANWSLWADVKILLRTHPMRARAARPIIPRRR